MNTKIAFIALMGVFVIAFAALNIDRPQMGTAAGVSSFEQVACPMLYNLKKTITEPMPEHCTYAMQGNTISRHYMCCNPSLEPRHTPADSMYYSI